MSYKSIQDLPWAPFSPGLITMADKDKFFWYRVYGYILYCNHNPSIGPAIHLFEPRKNRYYGTSGFLSREEAILHAMQYYQLIMRRTQ